MIVASPRIRTQERPTLGRTFTLLALGSMCLALVSLALVFAFEIESLSRSVSKDYAILYSNELVGDLEARLGREIAISVKAASSPLIQDWLLDEDNPRLQAAAARELKAVTGVFQGRDFFIAISATRSFRFLSQGSDPDLRAVSGVLDPGNPDDQWFFKSLELGGDYQLNVDTDRFIKTTRIWINAPVRRDGAVIGVLGTGLYLEPLVGSILYEHRGVKARSIVINSFGAIQLDQDPGSIMENSFAPGTEPDKTIFRYHDSIAFRSAMNSYLRNPTGPLAMSLEGVEYQYAAVVPINGTGWHAVTFFGTGQLYNPQGMIRLALVLALILALAVIVLSLGIREIFLKPFRLLLESLENRTPDTRASIAGLERKDEFGLLARSVADLADRLVRSVPVGMFLLDSHGRFRYGNPYFFQQFACANPDDFETRFNQQLPALFESDAAYHRLRQFLKDRREQLVLETRLRDLQGRPFWAEIHLNRIMDAQGTEEFEGILINIQHQKEYESRLINMATTDHLTGLHNRHHLEQTIATEGSRSDRSGNSLSLIMFDLDHFKLVNDVHGHDVGDEVLVQVAASARFVLRDSDMLVRWGGEEFAAILPDTGLEGAILVAEKIRTRLSAQTHPKAGTVTASFGVAQRLSYEPWSDWFKRADQALFKAKEEGRNRVSADTRHVEERRKPQVVQLVWTDDLNSGHPLIDSQHRALFRAANHALSLSLSGATQESLAKAMETLVQGLAQHMVDEEGILEGLGLPEAELDRHHKAHMGLDHYGALMLEQVRRPDISPVRVILDFVNEVVMQHMKTEDSRYFPITRAASPEGSPGTMDPDSDAGAPPGTA